MQVLYQVAQIANMNANTAVLHNSLSVTTPKRLQNVHFSSETNEQRNAESVFVIDTAHIVRVAR